MKVIKQPAVVIRRGSVSDNRILSELGARTFIDTFASANKPEDMAEYLSCSFSPAIQTRELRDPLAVFLIAEYENVAIGYAKLLSGKAPDCVSGNRPVELCRLYVDREWIGHGVGQQLMAACIDQVRAAGFQTLWLGVWEHNTRAQAFYRKWGFQTVGNQIFRLGADSQNDYVMELTISTSLAGRIIDGI